MHEPKLWHCDIMQAPDAPESVDLIVTSPPYNLGMDYVHIAYNPADSFIKEG